MKGNSGFTLLESLIVMLCISVFFSSTNHDKKLERAIRSNYVSK